SPQLVLKANVKNADITAVPRFIPEGRLRERTIAWLDRAFVAGHATAAQVTLRGPVRKFPFRNGEGEFRVMAQATGITLDYYPGFARLTDASGKVEFHNQSIKAELTSGQVGGVRL